MTQDHLAASSPLAEHTRLAAFAGEWNGEEVVFPSRWTEGGSTPFLLLSTCHSCCVVAYPLPSSVALDPSRVSCGIKKRHYIQGIASW